MIFQALPYNSAGRVGLCHLVCSARVLFQKIVGDEFLVRHRKMSGGSHKARVVDDELAIPIRNPTPGAPIETTPFQDLPDMCHVHSGFAMGSTQKLANALPKLAAGNF